MRFWFSANNSVRRSGLEACAGVRDGVGGAMSWSLMSSSGSGSDADTEE